MDYFTAIADGQGIILVKGTYRQAALYARAGRMYAKNGTGFVRLLQGGATSHPNVRWLELDTPDGTFLEKSGYVEYSPAVAIAAE
jgi:hypothetical protein